MLENSQTKKTTHLSVVLIAVALLIGLIAGGLISYSIISKQISDLQNQVSTLQKQLANSPPTQNVTYIIGDNASLSRLYQEVKNGVVVIKGVIVQTIDTWYGPYTSYSGVQGSGFVYNGTGQTVIITNYHVVQGASNVTVTFSDGNAYSAKLLGSDQYADLAVLSTDVPQYELKPLEITSSSTVKVGDPVIAVGNPLGLAGSMTSGIVSALGRSADVGLGYLIADCVQTTAPINPGNSGGPLLNYQGEVIGITSYSAATSEGTAAQGLGLAIPSSTILREIGSLVSTGSYNQHTWLGISGDDMTYEIAEAMDTNVTYGVLINTVATGGPADAAGLQGYTKQVTIWGDQVLVGGDIITAINGTRITNMDDLSTYLQEYTLPEQTVNVTITRNNQTMTLAVKLGTRP